MGKTCIAANCGNTNKDGVSLFRFPRNELLRDKWTAQVRRTRDAWKGPSAYSVLCSSHFSDDCFSTTPTLKMQFGMDVNHKKTLNEDAIPTIFHRNVPSSSIPAKKKVKRMAAEKLGRKRLITGLLKPVPPSPMESFSEEEAEPEEVVQQNLCVSSLTDACCQTENPKRKVARIQVRILDGIAKGTQVIQREMRDAQTQCSLLKVPDSHDSEISDSEPDEDNPKKDPDWNPTIEDHEQVRRDNIEDGLFEMVPDEQLPPHEDIKFVVFKISLQKLLSWCHCPQCGCQDILNSMSVKGSLLQVTIACHACIKKTTWYSQPFIGGIAAGNILLSAAVLYAGATISKILRVFRHLRLRAIESRTFFRHQNKILFPSIRQTWNYEQTCLVDLRRSMGDPIIVGGDGRADSRGHSAKYGTYTLMDLPNSCILVIRLVQSNECGGSYHMEKEGLIRCIKWLEEKGVNINTLITDRHRSIAKYIRENLDILHRYDVWHLSKALTKKLEALAREKECERLKPWIRSVSNHIYWCAGSTKNIDEDKRGEVIVSKWLSIINHVQNVHEGHSEIYPRCVHGRLEGRERQKKWLAPGSKVLHKFEVLARKPAFLKDLQKLSGDYQTAPLEAFHSLLSHFAPKEVVFSNQGMQCRTMLAAMHFNENSKRPQALTKGDTPRYKLRFPKYRKGEATVQKLLRDPTYEYVDRLMENTTKYCINQNTIEAQEQTPPPLCSQYERPDKDTVVSQHISRFNP